MKKTTLLSNGTDTITLVSQGYKQTIIELNETFTDTRVNAITMLRNRGYKVIGK